MSARIEATIEDLYRLPHEIRAEIVDGEIVTISPTGFMPGRAGHAICTSLRRIERMARGYAVPDNVAFYRGEPSGMRFLDGAPVFAAEVRSENDYGRAADAAIVRKRADYFAAGTLVVWDVDLLGDEVVKVYRSTDPDVATSYRRGEVAEAEPAVEGWTMPVDELFE